MRDKHEIWTDVRVKENCLSFVHRRELASEDGSQSLSLPLSIFLPTVLPVVIQKQKLNAEWTKKTYVKVSTYGCIFGHFNYTSQFFFFLLIQASMHARMHASLIARRDYTVLKYSVCNNDRRPVKVFQSVFFTGLLIFRFASTVKEYTT